MSGPPWRVERTQELRDDAEGLFIAREELPAAAVGDAVVVTDGDTTRQGSVAAILADGTRGTFVRITLD